MPAAMQDTSHDKILGRTPSESEKRKMFSSSVCGAHPRGSYVTNTSSIANRAAEVTSRNFMSNKRSFQNLMLMKTPFLTDHTSNMLLDSTKNNESSESQRNKLNNFNTNTNQKNTSGLGVAKTDSSCKKRGELNNSRIGSGRHDYISNIIGTTIGSDVHVKSKIVTRNPSSAKSKNKSTNFLKFLNTQ